jgi:hypothetical protein
MGGVYTSKSVNGVSLGSSGPFSVTGTQQWYMLTRYGQEYLFKTRALRQFQYIPGPQRFPNQYWPYYPYGWGPPLYYPPTGNPPSADAQGFYVMRNGQWINALMA